ncbi:TSPc domain-containing protein [Fusarium sp. LHS14.1]|nr:TSPc domain-containing protein [Fusarium sp. LHS14.1]
MIALGVLALVGLAAALEPRQIMHEGRDQPSFISARDYTNSDAEPCKIISQVYEESNTPKGKAAFLTVPVSVGIACLKSVPVDKERDLALLDYLQPLIEFQSTLEVLADPPEGYLFPGVNVLGGLDTIRDNLNKNKYKGQYEVMTDLRSLFAAANDLHFDYPPALLNTLVFLRRGIDFKSISSDGLSLPQIFHSIDVVRGNAGTLTYYPSAIKSIDGTPIDKWLEEDATRNANNMNDPDAQWNNLFSNLPRSAVGMAGTTFVSQFEIPDKYTIKFYNGTTLEVVNEIAIPNTVDFSGIESGEDFHEYFEIPHNKTSKTPSSNERRADTKESANLDGYPKPVVKHSKNSITCYFLEGEGYEKTAVISILSFLPIGFDFATLGDFNFDEYVAEAEEVLGEFIKKSKKAGRDKLIIDVSANGGGSLALAQSIYRVLFPDGEFTTFGRYRATESLAAATEADYETLLDTLITKSNEWPIDTKGNAIEEGEKWFGPYTIKGGQNMTAAFQSNLGRFEDDEDSGKKTTKVEPPWKPENILIVTDGTCASACTVLTGWLTRNYGIRTVALGGRPLHLAMQAMGGVKGTLLSFHSDLITATASFLSGVKNDKKALKILQDHEDAFPSLEDPPLLPLTDGANAGKVNALSGYTEDDVDGYPVHFRYEAANCRLFYTQRMLADPSETWKHVSAVGWSGAPCVSGSTVNSDGTIGDKALKYDVRVRSRARGVQGPGSLKK